jgi:hypothetical protein
MARHAIPLVFGLALLLGVAACGDYWVVGYGSSGSCWYDSFGNLYCGDGFYYGGVYTSAAGRPLASHEILRFVNDERSAAGLDPLALAEDLARVACERVNAWAGLAGTGSTASADRGIAEGLAEVGRDPPRSREAVGWGDLPPEQIVAGWMADPATRADLLDPGMREAGVGVAAREVGACCVIVFVGA